MARGAVWPVTAVACLGLLVLFGGVVHPSVFSWWYSVARLAAVLSCFGAVGALAAAVRALFRPRES